jgi:hypothetical protein
MSIFSRIKTAAASTSGTNPFNRVKEIVRAIKFSASPRLYGRFSSGAGEGEEIRIGSGLSIVNGELVASATNTINSSTASDGTANISVLTLDVVGTLTANHIHGNLAGSVYTHVRAGENLAKGDPVYVSGFHGSGSTLIPIVSRADAANPAKMPAIGIMDAALASNANGHMVIVGAITEFNTSAYAVNAELYVANGGGLTATPPAASSQAVGRVERVNANNGAFIVKVNGWASSGGNGTADANKLVRFGSTGTIPISSVAGSRSGIDSRTSFPNADVTAATNLATPNTLVRRDASGDITVNSMAVLTSFGVAGPSAYAETATFFYAPSPAAAHRAALGLTSLATTAAGTGVTTALAINIGNVGSIITRASIPSTPTSTGVVGQIAADSSFFYICTATNTWRRVALTTW